MKKIAALILVTSLTISTSIIAGITTHTLTKQSNAQTTSDFYWKIQKADDVIAIEDINSGIEKVLVRNEGGDTVTISCAGIIRKIEVGNAITCNIYEGKSLKIYIEKDQFNAGATGTYTLTN